MITARFETRESVELAVEHLVQQLRIPRDCVSIGPAGNANSSGTRAAGADDKDAPAPESRAPTEGALMMSVDWQQGDTDKIKKALMDVGATDVHLA